MTSDQTQIDGHVGARLRDIRRSRGVSQKVLAISAGLKEHQIEQFETGHEQLPSALLWRFSALFDVAPAEFYRGFDPRPGNQPRTDDQKERARRPRVKDTE